MKDAVFWCSGSVFMDNLPRCRVTFLHSVKDQEAEPLEGPEAEVTHIKIRKFLNKMDPGLGNTDNEILAAARGLHRLLKKTGHTFSDISEAGTGNEKPDSHLGLKNRELSLRVSSLTLDYDALMMKYEKLQKKLDALKAKRWAPEPGPHRRKVPDTSVPEGDFREFAGFAEKNFSGWTSLSELYERFCVEFPDSGGVSLTKFSLLMKKYLKRSATRGGPENRDKGFLFF